MNGIDFSFQTDYICYTYFPNYALKGISQWDTRRDVNARDAFVLDENALYGIAQFNKYAPGAQCRN